LPRLIFWREKKNKSKKKIKKKQERERKKGEEGLVDRYFVL
jgi:hypothetical protein